MNARRSESLSHEKGAVVVEFAVVFLMLLVLVFGILEFGFLWLQSHYINNAAREGARAAAKLNVDENPQPVVEAAVRNMLRGVYNDTVVDNPANCCSPGSFIAIDIGETSVDADGTPLRSVEVAVDVQTAEVWQPVLWNLINLFPGMEVQDIDHIRATALFVRQDQSPPPTP